MCPSKLNIGE